MKNWELVKETESFIVEYDKTMGVYRVSYMENYHFTDEIIFDEIKPECPIGCCGTLGIHDL